MTAGADDIVRAALDALVDLSALVEEEGRPAPIPLRVVLPPGHGAGPPVTAPPGTVLVDDGAVITVDLAGTAASLEDALSGTVDGGTVIVAAAGDLVPVQLDVYPDLHVRGLELLGFAVEGQTAR